MSEDNFHTQQTNPEATLSELSDQVRKLLAPHFSYPENLEAAVAFILDSAAVTLTNGFIKTGLPDGQKLLRHYSRFVSGAPELLLALEARGIFKRDDLVNAILLLQIPEAFRPEERRWLSYRKASIGNNLIKVLMSLDVIGKRQLPVIVFRDMAVQVAKIAGLEPEVAYKSVVELYKRVRSPARPASENRAPTTALPLAQP